MYQSDFPHNGCLFPTSPDVALVVDRPRRTVDAQADVRERRALPPHVARALDATFCVSVCALRARNTLTSNLDIVHISRPGLVAYRHVGHSNRRSDRGDPVTSPARRSSKSAPWRAGPRRFVETWRRPSTVTVWARPDVVTNAARPGVARLRRFSAIQVCGRAGLSSREAARRAARAPWPPSVRLHHVVSLPSVAVRARRCYQRRRRSLDARPLRRRLRSPTASGQTTVTTRRSNRFPTHGPRFTVVRRSSENVGDQTAPMERAGEPEMRCPLSAGGRPDVLAGAH